jgi:transposase-like protein
MEGKAPVVALVQRDGNVRSQYVEKVTAANLRPIINRTVAPDATIMTDSGTVLRGALMGRDHHQVNHQSKEFVRFDQGLRITTNTIEGFFGILKRGISGVYHHVAVQHLHRYLHEFDFRYNHRKITDGERTVALIKRVEGKRLMYKQIKPN